MRILTLGLLLAFLSPHSALAADRYVSPDGNDDGGANTCLSDAAPCETLAHAVALADAGDMVRLGVGALSTAGAFTVDKALRIEGAGQDATQLHIAAPIIYTPAATPTTLSHFTLTGDGALIQIPASSGDATLQLDHVTLEARHGTGFNISQAPTGDADLTVQLDDSMVYGLGSAAGFALDWYEGDVDLLLNNTRVEDLDIGVAGTFRGGARGGRLRIQGGTFAENRHGMHLALNASTQSRFHVDDISVSDNLDHGILIDAGQGQLDVQIANSQLNGNGVHASVVGGNRAGIHVLLQGNDMTAAENGAAFELMYDTANSIDFEAFSNSVTQNAHHGLSIRSRGMDNEVRLHLAQNMLDNNGGHGLDLQPDSSASHVVALIEANSADNNTGAGIAIDGGVGSFESYRFLNNSLRSNGEDGIRFTPGMLEHLSMELSGNVITGNGAAGLCIAVTDTFIPALRLDLRHNTLAPNAGTYDLDVLGAGAQVTAYDNWWGSTDTVGIRTQIREHDSGQVRFSALSDHLDFTLDTPVVLESGGQVITLRTEAGAPPFLPRAGFTAIRVVIDGTDATEVRVLDNGRTLQAAAPAHAPGSTDIVVINPNGSMGTLSDALTYEAELETINPVIPAVVLGAETPYSALAVNDSRLAALQLTFPCQPEDITLTQIRLRIEGYDDVANHRRFTAELFADPTGQGTVDEAERFATLALDPDVNTSTLQNLDHNLPACAFGGNQSIVLTLTPTAWSEANIGMAGALIAALLLLLRRRQSASRWVFVLAFAAGAQTLSWGCGSNVASVAANAIMPVVEEIQIERDGSLERMPGTPVHGAVILFDD